MTIQLIRDGDLMKVNLGIYNYSGEVEVKKRKGKHYIQVWCQIRGEPSVKSIRKETYDLLIQDCLGYNKWLEIEDND